MLCWDFLNKHNYSCEILPRMAGKSLAAGILRDIKQDLKESLKKTPPKRKGYLR